MQLVLLAAGHGRRFGGLKQLAPIGPHDEAIMDYTARSAEANGFESVVVVVRTEIRSEVEAHIRRHWPASLPVEYVCQAPRPGTAQAVVSARPAIGGPFAVANADDLYGDEALAVLVSKVGHGPGATGRRAGHHVLVAYRLERTLLTTAPVTRGLCEVGSTGHLMRIAEHTVQRHEDGSFDAYPLDRPEEIRPLTGHERVSMNLWGFAHRMFDHLEEALEHFDPASTPRHELLLPDVVNAIVHSTADQVQVIGTSARCIGVTHQEDLALVRAELAVELEDQRAIAAERAR